MSAYTSAAWSDLALVRQVSFESMPTPLTDRRNYYVTLHLPGPESPCILGVVAYSKPEATFLATEYATRIMGIRSKFSTTTNRAD